jgi:hypothetical protein
MDGHRFDTLVRSLASGTSRRKILKGILGIGAGAAAARGSVEAARRPTPMPKPVICPPPKVPSGGECVCPGGTSTCGPDCCPNGQAECCDNACCYGECFGEELCCPSSRQFCAVSGECCPEEWRCCPGFGCIPLGGCCDVSECQDRDCYIHECGPNHTCDYAFDCRDDGTEICCVGLGPCLEDGTCACAGHCEISGECCEPGQRCCPNFGCVPEVGCCEIGDCDVRECHTFDCGPNHTCDYTFDSTLDDACFCDCRRDESCCPEDFGVCQDDGTCQCTLDCGGGFLCNRDDGCGGTCECRGEDYCDTTWNTCQECPSASNTFMPCGIDEGEGRQCVFRCDTEHALVCFQVASLGNPCVSTDDCPDGTRCMDMEPKSVGLNFCWPLCPATLPKEPDDL